MRNLTCWFLQESQGVNAFDNIILLFLKVIYLRRRVLLRLVLARKEEIDYMLNKVLTLEISYTHLSGS